MGGDKTNFTPKPNQVDKKWDFLAVESVTVAGNSKGFKRIRQPSKMPIFWRVPIHKEKGATRLTIILFFWIVDRRPLNFWVSTFRLRPTKILSASWVWRNSCWQDCKVSYLSVKIWIWNRSVRSEQKQYSGNSNSRLAGKVKCCVYKYESKKWKMILKQKNFNIWVNCDVNCEKSVDITGKRFFADFGNTILEIHRASLRCSFVRHSNLTER